MVNNLSKLAATRGRPELPRSLKPRVDPNFLETLRGTDRNSLVNLRGTDTNFATLLNSPCQQLNGHFQVAWEKKKEVIFISMAWYLATFWNRGLGNSEIAYCNHTSKKTKNRDAKGHQKWSLFLSFFSCLRHQLFLWLTALLVNNMHVIRSPLAFRLAWTEWNHVSILPPRPPPLTQRYLSSFLKEKLELINK